MKIKISSISEFNSHQVIYGVYQCNYKELRKTKFGDPYISLTIRDATGIIDAKIWDNSMHYDAKFDEGDLIVAKGALGLYRNKKVFNVTHINRFSSNIYDVYGCSSDALKPTVDYEIDFIWEEVFRYARKTGSYSQLIEKIYFQIKDGAIAENVADNKKQIYIVDIYKALKMYDVLVGAEYKKVKISHDVSYAFIALVRLKRLLSCNDRVLFELLEENTESAGEENALILDKDIMFDSKNNTIEHDVVKRIFDIIDYVK